MIACPKCGGTRVGVLDSRKKGADGKDDSQNFVWRRRICKECGEKYTTYEIVSRHYDQLMNFADFYEQIRKLVETMEKGGGTDA